MIYTVEKQTAKRMYVVNCVAVYHMLILKDIMQVEGEFLDRVLGLFKGQEVY